MHPVLVEIGGLKVYSYGVFVAIGFLGAIWVAAREVERRGFDREAFFDMAFWIVLVAILGARAFHVLVFGEYYVKNPAEILKVWNGGLVFYGGFLAGVGTGLLYVRRHRIPALPLADACALGVPLGLAAGRLGCLSAGCCYGKPTALPWGLAFTEPASLAPLHVPLHPTQLYESLAGFAIFGVLYALRKRFETPGLLMWTMLILYGAARSFFELFRDDPRGFLGPLSESQAVSFILIAYSIVSIVLARRRARASA